MVCDVINTKQNKTGSEIFVIYIARQEMQTKLHISV